MSLLNELREWRNNQARIEGVESYRVFPNAVLEALVGALPENKEEIMAIKGIKEAKYRKYGGVLLKIIAAYSVGDGEISSESLEVVGVSKKKRVRGTDVARGEDTVCPIGDKGLDREIKETEAEDQTISVSQFLDGLNVELSGMAARVQGEVSSVDERERVVYFTIKDSKDESTLNCLIFRYQYDVSGVRIAIGDEIIVEGVPDIYKPSGRLSLKVGVIELAGAGALQKAYEALKLKLEQEGLFAPERKRLLPAFPERIALITSEQGAAIGDFTMNLGAQGLRVDFYPTAVEGKKAVFEIIAALRYFDAHAEDYDLLVVVRGGGSLESLQAFNNETLVREIAQAKIPTLLGIGHEKDVTLAALVADEMVSTPTATARTIRAPWDEARQQVRHFEQQLPVLFERQLSGIRENLSDQSETLLGQLKSFLQMADVLKQGIVERLFVLQGSIQQHSSHLAAAEKSLPQRFLMQMEAVKKEIAHSENLLRQYDPKRVLKLGYSLVRSGQGIVKDVKGLAIGDILDIQLSRGKIGTRVETLIEE